MSRRAIRSTRRCGSSNPSGEAYSREAGPFAWLFRRLNLKSCGGGGGVIAIHRADQLRHRAFAIKMRQIEATGAQTLATACANCRQTFDDRQAHFKWERKIASLLELVADNLAT
jgi:hypothetical protein